MPDKGISEPMANNLLFDLVSEKGVWEKAVPWRDIRATIVAGNEAYHRRYRLWLNGKGLLFIRCYLSLYS